ncbi:hypothetical protein [Quadrisphaera granulorum]|uniref:hypothetical protein n=1 Tax=Quadrisphaera granulorum TaxID=317664 RepID=UPI0011B68A0D|nr:hypothetical protein [Quadrisphaera granulorum]
MPDQFDGSDVVVDASELAAGTSSAADELVRELVVIRGAAKLVLIGGPDAFLGFLRESGERYGVADRLQETELDVPDVHYV